MAKKKLTYELNKAKYNGCLVIHTYRDFGDYSIYKEHMCLDDCWDQNEFMFLTPDDIGVLLDCIYEQAAQQKDNKDYYLACKRIGDKLSKIIRYQKRMNKYLQKIFGGK